MEHKIALAQINPTVGDLKGNANKIIQNLKEAKKRGAGIVVFPELAITGYPPKDLLLKSSFVRQNKEKLEEIAKEAVGIACVIGFVDEVGGELFNAAALAENGEVIAVQHKTHLPNYDVFDEKRYFSPSRDCRVFKIGGLTLGVNICEDIWAEDGPAERQAKSGAELVVNISASPFHVGKIREREKLLSRKAKENSVYVAYINLVGGQDELVFDGGSCILGRDGEIIARCSRFEEDFLVTDFKGKEKTRQDMGRAEEIYRALTLGVRDYVRKNGFEKAVVGLSGGIDSAMTAVIAVEALGPKNVVCVSMPSNVTSEESASDAEALARNLGIEFKKIPISGAIDAYAKMLSEEFKGTEQDITEENIQARVRGNVLMALSNKFGYMPLSTGNKSETAVGYTTMYGDMTGGLAVLSDVPKTMVYKLAEYANSKKKKVPESIIKKEPSAELREGQKDTDTLPPYDVLDPIINAYIEENKSKGEIIAEGHEAEEVEKVARMMDHSEYKRQQAPPGIRITPKAFGTGRRMPITNRYEG